MANRIMNGQIEPLAVPVNNTVPNNSLDTVTKLKHKLLPGARIILLVWLAIYVYLLGIGSYGVKKCQVQKYIPFYLIAAGGIGILSKFFTILKDKIRPFVEVSHILTCLYGVQIVLFLFGSYWVYKVYLPSYNPDKGVDYCDKTVYLTAFIYISILYAITIMAIAGFFCFLICIYFVKATEPGVDPEAPREP